MNCWICNDPATTGEHKIKHSDLKSALGTRPKSPRFFYHDQTTWNLPVQGFHAGLLKSASRLCAKCNNERTQPYDRAWEQLSDWLRNRSPSIKPSDVIRGNRAFPYRTTEQMRNVQLYFAKLTGCHLMEVKLNFDVASMSTSILSGQMSPYIYLKFGVSKTEIVGMSDLYAAIRTDTRSCAFTTWFYQVGRLTVNIMYAVQGERRQGLVGAWHPSSGSNRFVLADYP